MDRFTCNESIEEAQKCVCFFLCRALYFITVVVVPFSKMMSKQSREKRNYNDFNVKKRENAQMCANTSNSHDSPIMLHAMPIIDIKESH